MEKILITGGAGFIGSHLADRILKIGHKVVVIDNLSSGTLKNVNKKIKFYKADIQDIKKIDSIFKNERPDFIFHFAAQIDVRESFKKPINNAEINILGALNILENCRKYRVKKIIFASTGGAIYGNTIITSTSEKILEMPLSPYGVTKLTIEKYLYCYMQTYKLPFVSLRFGNVYGLRQNSRGKTGVIAIFCDRILNHKQLIINGDGKQTRDFVFINDAINAAILAMKKNATGIFNIGTGVKTDINTIFNKITELSGVHQNIVYDKYKAGGQRGSCLDSKKAKKELGWKPEYTLEKGLKETFEWFKNCKK